MPSDDPVLYAAQDGNKLLTYPFRFHRYQGTALFDTGADRTLVSALFANAVQLPREPSPIKTIKLADDNTLPVLGKTKSFRILLDQVSSTISGLILNIPHYEIILGLDWMRINKPYIDWDSSTLTIQRGGFNHHVYFKHLDTLMRDHVFVQITKTQDYGKLWDNCNYEFIHFKNIEASSEIDPMRLELVAEYPDVFLEKLTGLPPERNIQHEIDLKGTVPKARPIYKLTPQEDDALREYLKEALDKGLIRPSKSPFGAAVFFVPKKEGGLRLVTDYRALNEVTIKNWYPLPLIEDLFDALGKAKIFTKIDLTAGYHQIRVRPEDIPKTAFCTKYGSFECVVLNFGMTNAPSTFVTFMNEVFKDHIGKRALVYLDDIIIYSPSEKEHHTDVRLVLDTLRENKLVAKPSKCVFFAKELAFLGHIISEKGIAPDPDKIKAITNMPPPRDKSELRTFLGMIAYIRKFIPDCGPLIAPLTAITEK